MVLDGLRAQLMAPEAVKAFVAEFHRTINRATAEKRTRADRAHRDIETVEREIQAIVQAVKRGAFSSALQRELATLEARQAELIRQAAVPASPPVTIHPNASEIYRRKVADLHAAPAEPGTRAAAEALRGLIDEIRVTPEGDGNAVELTGELAALLRLSGSKNAASLGEAARSGLMDAGTRNHRQYSISVLV
jgi:site-specific DNA recombinase